MLKPKCLNQSQAIFFCLDQSCTQPNPFICCGCKDSLCINLHKNCIMKNWNKFYEQLQSTKTQTEGTLFRLSEIIQQIIFKLISYFFQQLDYFRNWIRSNNVSQRIFELFKLIKQNDEVKLCGSQFFNLMKQIDLNKNSIKINEMKVRNQTSSIQQRISQLQIMIRKLYSSDGSIPNFLIQPQTQKIRNSDFLKDRKFNQDIIKQEFQFFNKIKLQDNLERNKIIIYQNIEKAEPNMSNFRQGFQKIIEVQKNQIEKNRIIEQKSKQLEQNKLGKLNNKKKIKTVSQKKKKNQFIEQEDILPQFQEQIDQVKYSIPDLQLKLKSQWLSNINKQISLLKQKPTMLQLKVYKSQISVIKKQIQVVKQLINFGYLLFLNLGVLQLLFSVYMNLNEGGNGVKKNLDVNIIQTTISVRIDLIKWVTKIKMIRLYAFQQQSRMISLIQESIKTQFRCTTYLHQSLKNKIVAGALTNQCLKEVRSIQLHWPGKLGDIKLVKYQEMICESLLSMPKLQNISIISDGIENTNSFKGLGDRLKVAQDLKWLQRQQW